MKFTCFRSDMSNAVGNVQRAVSTKTTIPALEGILIQAYEDKLKLSGYDLEIGMSTVIEAAVSQVGSVVVSAKLLLDIVRKLPEEIIEFSVDERMVIYIKSGNADYQIVGIPADEYPEMPKFDTEDELEIKASTFRDMVRQTIFAVSELKDTPVYTGSYYEMTPNQLRIVTIDGFRMAVRTEQVNCEKVPPFIVPAKTQREVINLITNEESTIKLNIGKRHISFNIDNYSVISRLIEGTFINYQNTIPQQKETEVIIKTRRLLDSVERMSLITSDKIRIPLKLKFTKDGISLTCSTTIGKANDFISCDCFGKDVLVGFNHRFLIDALKNTDCDEVRLSIKGPLDPMTITPVSGDSFLFLVVPMRISAE